MIFYRRLVLTLRRTECRMHSLNTDGAEKRPTRTLKVAIVGSPNAGKSTLINQLVGRTVCGVSPKVHTTRVRSRAALVHGNTQVVFVDTPGVVSKGEMKRHHLEDSFEHGVLGAMNEAHLLGVIHDVSNPWTRDKLDGKILRLLRMTPDKQHFLILNKVDLLKTKSKILELVKILTNESPGWSNDFQIQRGWPDFGQVFMVSALNGDGTKTLTEYLLSEAKAEPWSLPVGVLFDKAPHSLILELVRARLLDALPEEVPYNMRTEVEYYHTSELGEIVCVVLLTCQVERHEKMLLRKGGKIVREIALGAEQDARNALQTGVRLRVVVSTDNKRLKRDHQSAR